MAAVGAYLAQLLLNASLKQTASFVSPATLGAGLSLGAPTSVSMSEVGTGSGYTPQSLSMASVGAAGTISSNAAAMTFGPFSSAQSVSGVVIKDTLGTAGNLHYFGVLATARTVGVGDSLSGYGRRRPDRLPGLTSWRRSAPIWRPVCSMSA